MDAKPYPEDKRRILIERSVEDFIAFLEEITDREGKQFIQQRLLPSQVRGFRKGHIPLKLQISRLLSKLKKEDEITNCDSVIWDSFKNAWRFWVVSHHELNKILLEFDNEADFDKNHKCIAPPNSELDIQCFKTLLGASRNNQIDQETIRRFYEYGYFNEDKQIQDLIDKAHPRAEIERQQRLEALPNEVDRLSKTIELLDSRVSATESADETEHKLDQRIAEVSESFETQLSKTKLIFTQMVGELGGSIESLQSRLSEVETLEPVIESIENRLAATEFANEMKRAISRLDQQIHEAVELFRDCLAETERKIAQIKTEQEEPLQITDAPRIAHQAVQIGERYAAELGEEKERYPNEKEYLSDFEYCLKRFGVTDSDETSAAIHVALKAFPALEIADTRVIEVWRLICNNHLHLTTIDVEMGWLGLQDWFPDLISSECFGERLERIDLDISIRKMLETGDMPWAIHLRNCDRSFPESYLPPFLDWVCDFGEGSIRVFLTRCSGTNRCETSEEVYARGARLPEPQDKEPIEAQNLRPSGIVVTRSDWESWCRPNADANPPHDRQLGFLNQLRTKIENTGVQIPTTLLREVRCYQRLSHDIMAPTVALDWALTTRLLPWIGNRSERIDATLALIRTDGLELPHFQNALQNARERES